MKISEYIFYKIKPDHIPKKYDDIMKLLARLERQERIYQEKQKAIRRINQLREIQRERNKQPDEGSIFKRCKYCDILLVQGEIHNC